METNKNSKKNKKFRIKIWKWKVLEPFWHSGDGDKLNHITVKSYYEI